MFCIKKLQVEDIDIIRKLDKVTGCSLEQEILQQDQSSNYYTYAIISTSDFVDDDNNQDKIIGYCTIEDADVVSSSNHWSDGDMMISEFKILEEYIDASEAFKILLDYILKEFPDNISIFLNIDTILDQNLYNIFGFVEFDDDGSILRPAKKNN